MIEIIPAIMTESEEEFLRQAHVLERAGVKRIHLDIADGMFVPRHTITGYEQLPRLQTDVVFDIHLMVQQPQQQFTKWWGIANAERFLVHVEALSDFSALHAQTTAHHKKLGASINPDTPMRKLEAVLGDVDIVQFMTVHPGAQGRAFEVSVLERVESYRRVHPFAEIIVDGGVTPETAWACANAGATQLVSGSYIARSADASRALHELQLAAQ